MGPLGIAGIMAGAQLAGGALNAASQGSMNRSTQRYNDRMYARQRGDAIADWNMMNEYNSPAAQMARFKAAGLNPNLIYGQTNESGVVRSSDAKSWNPSAPDFSFVGNAASGGIAAYYDMQLKQAQVDNIAQQTQVGKADEILRLVQASRGNFDLDLASELRSTSVDAARQALEKLKVDTTVALDSNERAAAANAVSISEGLERILSMRLGRAKTDQEIQQLKLMQENLAKDTELKRLDIELKRTGVQPSDELWQRILARVLSRLEGKEVPSKIFDFFKGSPKATTKEVQEMIRKAEEFQRKNSRPRGG